MSTAQSFSLWLVPAEPVATLLSDLIADLSQRYRTPPFPPHVTVLGLIEGITEAEFVANCNTLASSAVAMDVPLERADAGESLYRCVYAMCKREPPALLQLNAEAQRLFGKSEEYMPHLSLVYSNDLTLDQRRGIALETDGLVKELAAVSLTTMQAWSTTGSHDKWELLEEWPLPQPQAVAGGGAVAVAGTA